MENIDRYMEEINSHELLSREEELDLAYKIGVGDVEARQKMINSNLRFVVKIAHTYKKYNFWLLDLIQEGNIGLIKAIEKFDPSKGYKLTTYSAYWIRAYIQSFIVRSRSIVKLGTTEVQRKLLSNMRSTRNKMTTNREPTAEELAKKLSVKAGDIKEMDSRLAVWDLSTDEVKGDDQTYLDLIEDDCPLSDKLCCENERGVMVRTEIWKILNSFNERERYIIMNRLMSDESETHKEIGLRFSISVQRVGQIEKRLREKLREVFDLTELRPAA